MAASSSARDGVNCLAHLLEGSASADIGDSLVDILVGRPRLVLEQRRHRHDHAGLAIAALRNVIGDPGLLDLVQRAVCGETLDRGDLLAGGFADRYAAGARCYAADVDGAGPALCDAASVFGSGQAGIFADCPKQRRIRLDVDVESFAIDGEVGHLVGPLDGPPHLEGDAEEKIGDAQIKILQDFAFAARGITGWLWRYRPDARLSATFSALARSPRLAAQCGHDNNE